MSLKKIARRMQEIAPPDNDVVRAFVAALDPAPQNDLRNLVRPHGKRVPENSL